VTSNRNKSNVLSLKKLLITRLLLAFQFLTIIPVKTSMAINEADIAKSSSAFVVVGFIQGILLISTNYVFGRVFQTEVVTGIILLVLVLSNGGFHLDGLADTFDAFAAKGDKEKKLSIMKDSTIGPIGVIAVFFALLLKFLALNSLSHFSLFTFHFSLFLMPILPKWAMVISMFHGKPARENGLGRIFINNVRVTTLIFSSFLIILSYMLFVAIQIYFYKEIPLCPPLIKGDIGGLISFFVILFATLYIFSLISVKFFDRKFGGLTGDTLGAISEITEIIFLLMVNAWSRLFI